MFSFSFFGSMMIVVVKSNCFHITMFYEHCQNCQNLFDVFFFFMEMFINPFLCPCVIETHDFHNMWLCVKKNCSILMLSVFSF
jgi:hypothetical protein